MGTPHWLYYLFGTAMLLVAAYAVVLLVLSARDGDPGGRDIDIAHLFMGLAMAGMFVASWAFGPNWFWEAAFFALMIWFLVRSARSIQRFGVHVPHEAIHATMSFAMLLMYWYPMGASTGSMSMSMSMSSSHGILDPGLSFLLAFVFFGSAIFTLASPVKGVSHHGSHVSSPRRAYAALGGSADGPSEANPSGSAGSVLVSPVLMDVSHVVMCLGMGFMLILML